MKESAARTVSGPSAAASSTDVSAVSILLYSSSTPASVLLGTTAHLEQDAKELCAGVRPPHQAGQAYCRISAGMGRAQDATAAEPAADQTHSRAPGPGWWPSVPCAKKEHRGQVKRSKFPPTFTGNRKRGRQRDSGAMRGLPVANGHPIDAADGLGHKSTACSGLASPAAKGVTCRDALAHTACGHTPSPPTLAGWQGTADGKPACAVCESICHATRS